MFTDFQGVWTPVLLRKHLRNKPVAVQLAGVNLVLFRDHTGAAAALLDRCPHRGVALSLGSCTPDGRLACAFHGWEFNGRGGCEHVPFNPEAKVEHLRAVAFPVHEAGGLVWVHTAEATGESIAPPFIPESLQHTTSRLFHSDIVWQAHWTRVMENMIDNAHVAFVHRRTIGWRLQAALRRNSRLEVACEPTATGLFIRGVQDGKLTVGVHAFHRPNAMELFLDGDNGHIRVHVYCIPVNNGSTRLLVVGDFGWRTFLAQLIGAPINTYVVREDKRVVESSQPAEIPPPATELAVATDRATLQFRKYYYDVLKHRATGASTLRVVN